MHPERKRSVKGSALTSFARRDQWGRQDRSLYASFFIPNMPSAGIHPEIFLNVFSSVSPPVEPTLSGVLDVGA